MSRMKIVLKETVDNVGDAGDIVSVTGGYARNFLIPRGLAVPATKGNVRHAETWKNSKATKVAKAEADAVVTKGKLDGKTISLSANAGPDGQLFGSVTAANVATAVGEQLGVEVDRHDVNLEPIKSLGVHEVTISLHAGVSATVTVEVTANG